MRPPKTSATSNACSSARNSSRKARPRRVLPTPATLEKRIATADKKIAALEKTIGEVNGIIASDGPVIPVEAGVYFWHPNEVVCPLSGEDDRFMDYYPSSLIHFEAMLDCIARGVERFNFYGISGIFDANDPSYGVWQFKTRFGEYVEELPASSRCRWTDCASVYPKQRTSCCIADKQWRARTQK